MSEEVPQLLLFFHKRYETGVSNCDIIAQEAYRLKIMKEVKRILEELKLPASASEPDKYCQSAERRAELFSRIYDAEFAPVVPEEIMHRLSVNEAKQILNNVYAGSYWTTY